MHRRSTGFGVLRDRSKLERGTWWQSGSQSGSGRSRLPQTGSGLRASCKRPSLNRRMEDEIRPTLAEAARQTHWEPGLEIDSEVIDKVARCRTSERGSRRPPATGRDCKSWDNAPYRRPGPRRAPRGGSLLALHLPAPLGVEPCVSALSGARLVVRRRSGRHVLRSMRAASGAALVPSGWSGSSRVMSELNWSPPFRRAVVATLDRAQGSLALSHPAKRRPPHARAATGSDACVGPVLPAKRRTSSRAPDRREPGTKEREGETTASEWSFPRPGCRGKAPRSGCLAFRRQLARERDRWRHDLGVTGGAAERRWSWPRPTRPSESVRRSDDGRGACQPPPSSSTSSLDQRDGFDDRFAGSRP
jgi:hypothetical protein